jgi:hypothetical protein
LLAFQVMGLLLAGGLLVYQRGLLIFLPPLNEGHFVFGLAQGS